MKKYIALLKKISQELSDDKASIEACRYLIGKIETLIENEPKQVSLFDQQYPLPSEIQNGGYAAFSDGACRGNPGPGSWGFIVQDSHGKILVEQSDFSEHTTNNKMELTGAIRSLEFFIKSDLQSQKAFLFTDSTYVVKGITQWVKSWKARGWRKADKKAPENLELWQRLDELQGQFSDLHFRWVKGHSGHPQNERCDQLANIELDEAGY